MTTETPNDTTNDHAHQLAREQYVESDLFRTDAVEWFANTRELPADLIDAVCAHYVTSTDFGTAVDDITNGWREL